MKVKLVVASSSSRVKFNDGTIDLPALPTDEAAIQQQISVSVRLGNLRNTNIKLISKWQRQQRSKIKTAQLPGLSTNFASD